MNDCCACDCGRLVVIASERSISALSRSSSLAGNAGLRATSATSAIISGANSASASPPIVVSSEPTPTLSDPPMLAASSAICSPLRVVVPSTIMSPTRSASHTSSAASSTFPTRMTSSTATFGTVPYWSILTSRPLSSVKAWGVGSVMFFAGAGSGGTCFCAAAVTGSVSPSSIAAATRRAALGFPPQRHAPTARPTISGRSAPSLT